MSEPDQVPPGWSANPSAWSQRLPIVGLALAGAAVAAYGRVETLNSLGVGIATIGLACVGGGWTALVRGAEDRPDHRLRPG